MENKENHNKKQEQKTKERKHQATVISLMHKEHPNRLITIAWPDLEDMVSVHEIEYSSFEAKETSRTEYELTDSEMLKMLDKLLAYGYKKIRHKEVYV